MSYSSHIKHNTLKELVLKDVPCEEKLTEIRKLLGMPQVENEDSSRESVQETDGSGVGEVNGQQISRVEEEEVDDRKKSIDRIVEGLKGKNIKLAQIILREIEKSASLRWNYDSLEIVIDSEPVLHSNIKLLLEKLLEQRSPTFPLGLHKFINALISIKLPQIYFRGSDAKNIREFLLGIEGKKVVTDVKEPENSRKREREVESEEESQENSVKRIRSDSGGEETEAKALNSESGESKKGVKRSRSDSLGEDDAEEGETGEEEVNPAPKVKKKRQKRVFDFTGDPPRRSGRKLKAEVEKSWAALDNDAD